MYIRVARPLRTSDCVDIPKVLTSKTDQDPSRGRSRGLFFYAISNAKGSTNAPFLTVGRETSVFARTDAVACDIRFQVRHTESLCFHIEGEVEERLQNFWKLVEVR